MLKLLKIQHSKCYLCPTKFIVGEDGSITYKTVIATGEQIGSEVDAPVHIDHTGVRTKDNVRGLLCGVCNPFVANARVVALVNDPVELQSLKTYVKTYPFRTDMTMKEIGEVLETL